MQAVAAELSGCAGQFRCFLERRVLIAKLKNSRTQELKKNQQSRAEVRIAAFLHS